MPFSVIYIYISIIYIFTATLKAVGQARPVVKFQGLGQALEQNTYLPAEPLLAYTYLPTGHLPVYRTPICLQSTYLPLRHLPALQAQDQSVTLSTT